MGKSAAHSQDYLQYIYQAQNGLSGNSLAFPSMEGFEVALLLSNGSELSYTGYTRLRGTFSTITFNVSGTTASNGIDFDFPVCTGNGQTATKFKIYAGNGISQPSAFTYEVGSGNLNGAVSIGVGDTPKFLAGDLTITES